MRSRAVSALLFYGTDRYQSKALLEAILKKCQIVRFLFLA